MTEPTEPLIHHTVVAFGKYRDRVDTVAVLPDDWEPGTPVVVSTVPPDGVAVAADGRMVLLPGAPLPEGWEARRWADMPFRQDREGPWGRPMEVRPVPAPEPATERVPWWTLVDDEHTLLDGGEVMSVTYAADEAYALVARDDVSDYDKVALDVDDDGLVTVLRDADPAPSVVPADSPDTGRWHVDHDGDLFPPSGSHWYEAHSNDREFDEAAACQRLADLLNRRDRPQPTAEQVELHYLRQLLHAVDVGINALMADLPGTTESALAVMRHARDTAQAAVVACRTTEGTGE